jgi:Spy/CpxP family protein refolding chaperone
MYSLKRNHVAAFLLASSVALGLAPTAQAQGEPMHGPMGMHHGGPMMMLRGLDLTEAQRDQVFQIFHEQAPAFHEQMKQVRQARENLMKLAAADRFDESQARQAADAQAKALSALALMHAQTMHRVRDILTPEQRARLDERAQRRQGEGQQ